MFVDIMVVRDLRAKPEILDLLAQVAIRDLRE